MMNNLVKLLFFALGGFTSVFIFEIGSSTNIVTIAEENTISYLRTKMMGQQVSGNNRRNYSILAAAIPNFLNDTFYYDHKEKRPFTSPKSWVYLFHLPLTSILWRRLGYDTIVIMTVDYKKISAPALQLMNYVKDVLKSINSTVVVFDVPSEKMVRLSQCLRLAAGQLPFLNDDDIIATDDVDMWPFMSKRYNLPAGKSVHIANAHCCGRFKHKNRFGDNQTYREYPMSSIVMPSRIWKSVFGKLLDGFPDDNGTYRHKSVKPLEEKLEKYAKTKNIYSTVKGDELWFTDQRYSSYMIEEWLYDHGHNSLSYEDDRGKCERIHQGWNEYQKLTKRHCVDIGHMITPLPWGKEEWSQTIPLFNHIFTNSSFLPPKFLIDFLNEYKTKFKKMKLFGKA